MKIYFSIKQSFTVNSEVPKLNTIFIFIIFKKLCLAYIVKYYSKSRVR